MVYRALNLCDNEHRNNELKHIEKALNKNGYPSKLVHKAIRRQSANLSQEKIVEDDYKGITFMPFVKGVSDKICRFLNRAGVKTYFTKSTKLRDIVSKPKDPMPKGRSPCVYRLAYHVVVVNNILVKPKGL